MKEGRNTVMTPEVLAKLEGAFALGHSDREACIIAGIDPATLYRYCEKDKGFASRKELLKETPTIKARRNIIEALNAKDVPVSQWYIKHKTKEFIERQDITSGDEAIVGPIVYLPKEEDNG